MCVFEVLLYVQYSMVFSSRSWRVCAIMTWLAWALLSLLMRRSCAASLALASSSSLAWTSLRDCWYFLMDFCARDRYSCYCFSHVVYEKNLLWHYIFCNPGNIKKSDSYFCTSKKKKILKLMYLIIIICTFTVCNYHKLHLIHLNKILF